MKRFTIGLLCVVASTFAVLNAQEKGTQSKKQAHAPGLQHAASGDMQKHMQEMNKMMVHHLGKTDPDYERRFIDMMVPHHEGAIMMARHALENANRPELKEQARKIIEAQEKEIAQFKKWRKEWYP